MHSGNMEQGHSCETFQLQNFPRYQYHMTNFYSLHNDTHYIDPRLKKKPTDLNSATCHLVLVHVVVLL